MNRLEIYKYLASHDDVRKITNNDLYMAQKEYYKNAKPDNTFDTYKFIASNMKEIVDSKEIELTRGDVNVNIKYKKNESYL